MIRILILCTGNSCRSQMAQAILQNLGKKIDVYSAGTAPTEHINPYAIMVMKEIGIDISGRHPKNVSIYLNQTWDYVITVCNNAKESCPAFTGDVKNVIHIAFDDPALADGTEEQKENIFRKTRDQIIDKMGTLFTTEINDKK